MSVEKARKIFDFVHAALDKVTILGEPVPNGEMEVAGLSTRLCEALLGADDATRERLKVESYYAMAANNIHSGLWCALTGHDELAFDCAKLALACVVHAEVDATCAKLVEPLILDAILQQ